ncbi:MAG: hypothetical protein B7X00_01040 [Legionella sp. 21-45-4]|nr:MAG: hypothetical protein B7X00_01040 [Legionella sp. 21-45-4]
MAHEVEIKVPDIGGAQQVDVIEILVAPGDVIAKDTSLVTLESDKASMEIPSPKAGKVISIALKVGDKIAEGDLILTLSSEEEAAPVSQVPETRTPTQPEAPAEVVAAVRAADSSHESIFAGPSARRLARVLGLDLQSIQGTGRKGRITQSNVEAFVKQKLDQGMPGTGFAMPTAPVIDFSQFGEIEFKPLSKIKRLTGQNVQRAWLTIPHVTQFDEADITDLEAFRQAQNKPGGAVKFTLLAFVCKVVSRALELYPLFNASLDATGSQLIYKRFINIGIAVETPNGLVVPVIRDANHLQVREIAEEMARLSTKAREKGLMPNEMNGGTFTISSLGGIGGTAFTPIVNSPEVAILGLSRSSLKPVYDGKAFVPRLMLPLSLSYDHRVIDGAEAARFTRFLAEALSDIRQLLI